MNAIIYSKEDCTNCKKAKAKLTERGVLYIEMVLGKDITREEFLSLFPQAKTVPQIILNGVHIGGYQELLCSTGVCEI